MNIYLIARMTPSEHYDTYYGAVVIAKSAKVARNMHPENGEVVDWDAVAKKDPRRRDWVSSPSEVFVSYVGRAGKNQTDGVVLSSFFNG